MIASFRDDGLRRFFVADDRLRQVLADVERRLFRKLRLIDDATCDADLRDPPGDRFEKLRGALDAYHPLRVNDQWRLVFRWGGATGEAHDLYLDDHSYR